MSALAAILGGSRRLAVVWDGDSHIAETVPGVGNGYPSKTQPYLRNAPIYVNKGVGGATVGLLPHPGSEVYPGSGKLVVLQIGTNDYNASSTSSAFLAALTSKVATYRSQGAAKVIVGTTFPSTLFDAGKETQRNAGNAALSGVVGVDAVIDWATRDARIGTLANFSNGLIGDDGIHANAAGCAILAAAAAPVINAVLAGM